MRRFMQTFVLAPQSAKNYYVRNDIFRYQDEVFNDEESESENGSPSGKLLNGPREGPSIALPHNIGVENDSALVSCKLAKGEL